MQKMGGAMRREKKSREGKAERRMEWINSDQTTWSKDSAAKRLNRKSIVQEWGLSRQFNMEDESTQTK